MKKTTLAGIIIIFLSAMLIAGCTNSPPPIEGGIDIQLTVDSPCSPSDSFIIIRNWGPVIYQDHNGSQLRGNISSEDRESLKKLIIENDFFSIKEYTERCPDASKTKITVSTENKARTYSCTCKCPEKIREISDKIKGYSPGKLRSVGCS